MVTILIAGLLINDRAGVITAVASILSGLVMAYTESRGLLPTLPITYSPYTYFVIIAFFLLTVIGLTASRLKHLASSIAENQSAIE